MEFDLVVVGGGLAGASLAVALRSTSLKIAVIESRAPVRASGWDSRIYAISPANQLFLAELGIWRHLDASRLTPVVDMVVSGDTDGVLRFSAYDTGLGELAWTAESSLLQSELWETLKRQHNVTLFCPALPISLSVEPLSVAVSLDDGRRLRARLIVGADGVNSWVREQVGIDTRWSPYGETAVVANFRCERSHRNIAYQWFSDDGILAYLPLAQDRISIVWSASQAFALTLLEQNPECFCATVEAAGGGVLGKLAIETAAVGFPLRMMRVAELVRPRVALIGDAAHAIHPLSGHGINLGLQDAKALAEQLDQLPTWRDPGDLALLRAYARARAEQVLLLQYTTHGLNCLFNSRNPFLALLRNSGMNLVGRMPLLKDAFVRYAASSGFR